MLKKWCALIHRNTPFGLADLEAVVRVARIVRLPKTDSKKTMLEPAQVERIERECGRGVGSTVPMAAIESAKGVVNAVDIATSSLRMVRQLRWRYFDYVMDMGTSRKRWHRAVLRLPCSACGARCGRLPPGDVVFGRY